MKLRSILAGLVSFALLDVGAVAAQDKPASDKGAPLDLQAPQPKKKSRPKKDQAATPVSPTEAIAKANAYFNSAQTMIADFVQIGADGRRAQGKLYVVKPGRMLFTYDPPAPLEIVSDGASVAVQDLKLKTKDVYSIGQTPLKFLLENRIDLAAQTKVVDVRSEPRVTTVQIEDSSTFGGSSKISLNFDTRTFKLRQWIVADSQGYETTVSLFNVDLRTMPDPNLFQLHDLRIKAGAGTKN